MFPANVGLRQGFAMSPWLFNLFMDGVIKEFKQTFARRSEMVW